VNAPPAFHENAVSDNAKSSPAFCHGSAAMTPSGNVKCTRIGTPSGRGMGTHSHRSGDAKTSGSTRRMLVGSGVFSGSLTLYCRHSSGFVSGRSTPSVAQA
jgi:hypothetical protein